jgi:hypothetical protein
MAWSSGRDPSAPILYWISEEIKLVSPRGWSLPTQPIYFRAPSRWSGTHHELAIVGGIEVAWGYDYHVPMASLRIRPRSTELTPMVKITYILGRNHCAVVKAGERERIVLGWRCAFCSLDELGGEEELLLHYSLAHREDCEVEILEPRETVSGSVLKSSIC